MQVVAGLLLLGAGFWAVVRDAPVWNAVWYVPAWYGYLLLLDAAIGARSGFSFVDQRRRELAEMLFWSLPFWFFFEACNLVLRDWYYVFCLRNRWASAGMATLAFATVLPICFFHARAVESFSALGKTRCRRWMIGRWTPSVVGLAGFLCLSLALLLPRLAFPLVWFAPIGLEATNYRRGAPSLLRDLEEGRPGRLLSLLAGGVWAGLVWELLNSWARCKWIYAVPGFENVKLFEMPLAGFLGFPVLAVGAFVYFSFVQQILRPFSWPAVLLAVLFCAAVEAAVERRTVASRRPLLEQLAGLEARSVEHLKSRDIETPELLVRAVAAQGVAGLAVRADISPADLQSAWTEASLAIHKGMGVPRAALLEASGVRSVADLAHEDPQALWQRLAALAARRGEEPPRTEQVRVWVNAARRHPEAPSR